MNITDINPQLMLSHRADIRVAADRIFRSVMRACRCAGTKLPIALKRANEITLRETGIDMLSELQIDITQNYGYADYSSHLQFLDSWMKNQLPVPCAPCSSMHLYMAYQHWQKKHGGMIHPINKVLAAVESHCGFSKKRVRYTDNGAMASIVFPHGLWPITRLEISQYMDDFKLALDTWVVEK